MTIVSVSPLNNLYQGVNTSSLPTAPAAAVTLTANTWGKPIPRSWGSVRVSGSLIWASSYYALIGGFSDRPEYYNDYDGQPVESEPGVVITSDVNFGIDLCYSFGFEGILNSPRLLRRLRINGVLVYDLDTGILMSGIGFGVRYAREGGIEPIMGQNPITGKFYYPGQTYVTFERFRTALWGNAIPQTIDAEFIVAATPDGDVIHTPAAPDVTDFPNMSNSYMCVNHRTRVAYCIDYDHGLIHSFNIDTNTYIQTVPIYGAAYEILTLPSKRSYVYRWGNGSTTNYLQGANVLISGSFQITEVDNKGYVYTTDLETGFVQKFDAPTLGNVDTVEEFYSHNIYLVDGPTSGTVALCSFVYQTKCLIVTATRGVGNATFSFEVKAAPAVNMYGKGISGTRALVTGAASVDDPTRRWFLWDGITAFFFDVDLPVLSPYSVNGFVEYDGSAIFMHPNPDDGGVTQKVRRYSSTGQILYDRVMPFVAPNQIPWLWSDSEPGNDAQTGFLGIGFAGVYSSFSILNCETGAIDTYPIAPVPSFTFIRRVWDSILNNYVYLGAYDGAGLNSFGRYGPVLYSARVALIDFMRSLYTSTGLYVDADITADVAIRDMIIGAVLDQSVNLNATIEAICTLYKINKIEDENGIYFYRNRTSSMGLDIALILDVSELAIENFDDDEYTAFKTTRGALSDAPSEVSVSFLDPNNDFSPNTVSWRRNSRVPTTGPVLNLSVPIVMPTPEALVLAQGVLNGSVSSTAEHTFRLTPKHAQLVRPGDIIQVKNGAYLDTVQITQHDLNGDFSASCMGITVANENSIDVAVPEILSPAPADVATTVAAVGYVIDGPLLTPSQSPGPGNFMFFEGVAPSGPGNFYGAYFARRKVDGEWGALPTIQSSSKLPVWSALGVLTDRRWVRDTDTLQLSALSGVAPAPATFAALQANEMLNVAYYGKPGRWEVVQFEAIAGGIMSGILRGLRGSEVHCGAHEVGDFIVLPTGPVLFENRPLEANVGTDEEYRPVSIGKAFGSAVTLPALSVEAVSTRTFAPAALAYVWEPDGALSLAWDRRDRLGSGWGVGPLPLSEVEERYRVTVKTMADVVLHTFEVVVPIASYSDADQTADGVIPPFVIVVQQLGETGYGAAATKVVTDAG